VIPRLVASELRQRAATTSAVTLLGPRQIGKTTMAVDLAETWEPGAVYLDAESPSDRRRLEDAEAFFRGQAPRLVVVDEIHRLPGLFETLRGIIDENRRAGFRNGQFLLLGSASLELSHMASESLAGRVSALDLAGVGVEEAAAVGIGPETVWLRGGYPDSLTADDDAASLRWRLDLVRTYLERDAAMFAPRVASETLRRLWTMLAHVSGGLLNASRLAASLGVSGPTVTRHIDLLVDLGLVRLLAPWHVNVAKRVTKAPKVFVRDTGLLHALLEVGTSFELRGHPAVGASFESFVVEAAVQAAGETFRPFHFRTAKGDEVDLVLVRGGSPVLAVEAKLSTAPTVSPGFHRACDLLGIAADQRLVCHPDTGKPPYRTAGGTTVLGVSELVGRLRADSRRTLAAPRKSPARPGGRRGVRATD
jgi:predicted AAA+ superfamily ATPase